MVKNLLFIFLAGLILASCTQPAKNEYTISGNIDSVFDAMVYIQKRADGPLIPVDSTRLSDGNFIFKGTIDYPEVYYITIPAIKSSVPFFIEASNIDVKINTKDINKTKIKGSKAQADYDSYLDMLEQFNAKLKEGYQLYNKAEELDDQEKVRYYDSVINAVDEQRSQFSKNYVLENPGSFVSPYIVYRNSYTYELEELETALNAFDSILSNSMYTNFMEDYRDVLKRTEVGEKYVPFSMADSTGTEIALTDFIGSNYLLVDFWASWCSPCRQENPNLVALYDKYHDKGFDIFGVSFDSNRDRWLGAISNDKLTWTHVSDLQGWANAAGKLYGIRSIPSNVIIDPSGTIIAKNLRGDDLKAKLAELFPAGT